MTSINKVMRVLALAAILGAGFAVQAEAIPIVSVSPSSTSVAVGDTFSIDILVSGLGAGEEVGGYSLFLAFDSSKIKGTGYTDDPDSKMSPGTAFPPVGFGAGGASPLELFFVADAGTDLSTQGGGFRLARVTFEAIAPGLSRLKLSKIGSFLSDGAGADLPATAQHGSVCVGDPAGCKVPEPGLLALLGAGLSAFAMRRRSLGAPRA